MTWFLLKSTNDSRFERHITAIYASDEAAAAKEAEWRRRTDLSPWTKEIVNRAHLDIGGMVSVDQEILHRSDFYGGTLSCHAIHVDFFVDLLEKVKPRPNGFFLVPGWPGTLMLLPKQRIEILDWLRSVRTEARAIADIENAAFNREFVENPTPYVNVAPRPVKGRIEDA